MPIFWNSLDKDPNVILSNGNLSATFSTAYQNVRATIGKSTGKWYWEVKIDSLNGSSYPAIGITTLDFNIDTGYLYTQTHQYTYGYSGRLAGVTFRCKLDMDAKTLQIFQDNVLIKTTTGIAGEVYPTIGETNNGGAFTATANFGDSIFSFIQPIGYKNLSLNTEYILTKNKISLLAIGEAISCEYVATANAAGTFSNFGSASKAEINLAGTNTPNGSFNFVKVDKGLLIADRVIQTGVSWDVLNAAKLIEGRTRCLNDLTDSLATSAFSASSIFSASFSANKAFNNTFDEVNGGWQTPSGTIRDQWLKVDFTNPVAIAMVRFQHDCSETYPNSAIRNFRIESSSDNSNWIIQYVGVGSYGIGMITTAKFTPTGSFRYWRIYIVDNYGGSYIMISEAEMSDTQDLIKLRVPSGGNCFVDEANQRAILNRDLGAYPSHNEWDTYVVNSTLGGKITAGNNAIWNWSNGSTNLNTWTTNSPHSSFGSYSANRVTRGYGSARTFNGTSDYISFTNAVIPLGAKSIKFKIKIPSIPTVYKYIMGNMTDANTQYGFESGIDQNTGKIYFMSANATSNGRIFTLFSSINICDNNWHDIMFTWDGTTTANAVKVYVDDMTTFNNSTTATSQETNAYNTVLNIGRVPNGNGTRNFLGSLDEFKVYNSSNNLVLYLSNEYVTDSSTAAKDMSGNGYDGTVSGTTFTDNAKLNGIGFPPSSTISTTNGFRPVLIYTE